MKRRSLQPFRKHTRLPLDDCLYALQESIPHLTRSTRHRCLQRHGISRLPDLKKDGKAKKKFKAYAIGFFHIDITELGTGQGEMYLFVAIDRISKFVMAKLYDRATMKSAKEFPEALTEAVPYRIHTVLTDNGIQFADLPKNRNGMTAVLRGHPFDRVCRVHSIEHRLTKPNHPWTNGQVERMNRTIKEATVNRYYYQTHEELQTHPDAFISACNFAKRLKTLHGLTPYEFVMKTWSENPCLFHQDPYHLNLGLYTCTEIWMIFFFCNMRKIL